MYKRQILKWAETSNGFIAPTTKDEQKPVWISNEYSKQLVHKWRAEEQAILVGTNTAEADNPKLNVRSWSGENPIRVVLDKNCRLDKNLNVFDTSVKTIFIVDENQDVISTKENIIFEQINFEANITEQICAVLHNHKIQSVIIEGGTQILQTFIDANLWDEARVFVGQNQFESGVEAPIISAKVLSEENIEGDILKILIND